MDISSLANPEEYATRARRYTLLADAVETELRAVPASEDTARQWEHVATLRQTAARNWETAALVGAGEFPVMEMGRWGLRLRVLIPLRDMRPHPDLPAQWLPPRTLIVRPIGARRPGWHRQAVRLVGCVAWEKGHALAVPHRRTARGLELRLDWRRGSACPRHTS